MSIIHLDDSKHKAAKVNLKAVRHYMSQVSTCRVNINEFYECSRWFPIIFSESKPHAPFVVMSIEKNRNQFCTEKNGWEDGVYMPINLARYPFYANERSDEGWLVSIDSEVTAKRHGQNLFTKTGKTSYLETKIRHCVTYAQSNVSTTKFVSLLEKHKLLKLVNQKINTIDGMVSAGAFYIVDPEKVNRLSEQDQSKLKASKAWSLMEIHIKSLPNFQNIANRTASNSLESAS